jgi:hypothetical protein
MNDRIRRPLIFGVIVGAGTLFIFFDLPLLLILPLILAIGLVLLILLGALPVAELKAMLSARLKRGAKKPVAPSAKPASPAAAAPPAGKARDFPSASMHSEEAGRKGSSSRATAAKQGIGERVRSLFAKKLQRPCQRPRLLSGRMREPQAKVRPLPPSQFLNRLD